MSPAGENPPNREGLNPKKGDSLSGGNMVVWVMYQEGSRKEIKPTIKHTDKVFKNMNLRYLTRTVK